MKNDSTYLLILISTLSKKNNILDDIIGITLQQEGYLKATPQDMESFEKTLDRKADLIESLNQLDEGFESVYERVKEELSINKERFQTDIMKLQELIRFATDKSIKLKALEQQNKRMMEVYFTSKKNEIKNFKKSNATATNYYRSMVDMHQSESYFLDKKK